MNLVEITRFADVYEADLAASFLASHDIEVSVTERFQTTVDPLMQRALGIRLMGRATDAEKARLLLDRAQSGEFVVDVDDAIVPSVKARWAGRGVALFSMMVSGYPSTSLPRTLRPLQIAGIGIIGTVLLMTLMVKIFG